MLKHLWSLIAESSTVDQFRNTLSIDRVLEEVQVALPANAIELLAENKGINISLSFHLVTLWLHEGSSEESFTIKVIVINPEGKEIGQVQNDFTTPKDDQRLRTIQRVESFPITGPGRYWLRLSHKRDTAKSFTTYNELPLDIKVTKDDN